MKITVDSKIGDVVALDYRTATIFENYKIDFCCGGYKTIGHSCRNNSEAENLVEELTAQINLESNSSIDFNSWQTDLLIDYIIKKHHRYVLKSVPIIKGYLTKICSVHGIKHPELFEIRDIFFDSVEELSVHMKKEEDELFPYILSLIDNTSSFKNNFSNNEIDGNILVKDLIKDHENEGEKYRRISELTNNFTTPDDGCTTYNITLLSLKEFQSDLHLHVHLENNILFPRAVMLETIKTEGIIN
jgi:regulator of cell morphogenesis and NO signaling